MSITWLKKPVKQILQSDLDAALAYQNQLTKPAGSLGRLEDIAIRLSAMQQTDKPSVDKIHISVFAADHGIAEENVSAFPQVVTTEMIKNFARGGAAISVLAKQHDACLEVIDLGAVIEPEKLEGVLSQRIAAGTNNFSQQAAMTEEQLAMALQIGHDSILRAIKNKVDIYIGGEMGIANTTTAAAIAAAILQRPAEDLVGPGTGVNAQGVAHKASVVNKALKLHANKMNSAEDILRCVGWFEIAGLCGAYIAAAQQGLPVLIDGFISSVAALAASKINPQSVNWFIYCHRSAEPGHKLIMEALNASPLLDIGMRLGEGSGAAVAVSLLKSACALHNQMCTFADAGVSVSE
ncbi:MAG: nicotinate-nucleotide--dimethylbenzimidazole phosphoribosyltransferase [Gammaproteobacteria bacterium]|nr:nicotinate-nucleotide--dimethylbenzimidazole phosphoribosyltransferase [Gammaproteobacteria bacterium]